MHTDYQEFAAAFARQCRARRNAEDEAQREVDELTKPAIVPSAADVRKTGAGAGPCRRIMCAFGQRERYASLHVLLQNLLPHQRCVSMPKCPPQ
jgi:hypothetical protein